MTRTLPSALSSGLGPSMNRRPALQPGNRVRLADGKFDPALIVRVKQVDGDLVEAQLGGGSSASFHCDQIRIVPDGSDSAKYF